MRLPRRLAVVVAIIVFCLGCDQGTKSLAERTLAGHPPRSIGLLQLSYVHNHGAFLSLGAGLSARARFWCFVVLAVAGLVAVLALALWNRRLTRSHVAALALVSGGGLSNIFDRVTNGGAVIDFLHFHVGPVGTGIFNVADVAIVAGAVLFLFSAIRRGGLRPPGPAPTTTSGS